MVETASEKTTIFKEEIRKLHSEARKQTFGYIITAFGLIAGLAWNEAVKSLIEAIFPLSANSVTAKFTYALIITIVVVLISIYLGRLISEKNISSKEKAEEQ
ncbi:MAG: DUF5654 family protein [bacterium]|nr:DUF5654 family protein [bacterium]